MKLKVFILIVFLFTVLSSCKVKYSFTGGSVDPKVKTVSIQYFPNNAPIVVATLSQAFTQALRDRFSSQTRLTLVNYNGDMNIEGSITGYSVQPQAIQGNQTAALNRLTITVNVKFTNKIDEKQNFEQSFSRYEDYSSSLNLSAVQDGLIQDISSALIDDIYNKTVVNW